MHLLEKSIQEFRENFAAILDEYERDVREALPLIPKMADPMQLQIQLVERLHVVLMVALVDTFASKIPVSFLLLLFKEQAENPERQEIINHMVNQRLTVM